MRPSDDRMQAIGRVFSDPTAVLTIDEVAGRFGMTLSEAVRAMSDLEAIGVVRRIGDEYIPGVGQVAVANSPSELGSTG